MSLLLAPVVRARRLFSPRVGRISPFVKGNPLAEARSLNRAGYVTAAVFMARMAIERRLHELMVAHPMVTCSKQQKGIHAAATVLLAVKSIQKHEVAVIERFCCKANKIVHGTTTTKLHARRLIVQAGRVLSMLEKKGGAV
jgi:hypothetical protein